MSPRESQGSIKLRDRLNITHFQQDRRKRFEHKLSHSIQPFLLRVLTVFWIKPIKADANNGSVRVSDDPAGHKMAQMIRYRSEGDRFISRRFVNFRARGRTERKTVYVCASGQEGFKPNAASSPPTSRKSQGLTAKPPTRKMNYFRAVRDN